MDLVITESGRDALVKMLSTCEDADRELIRILESRKTGDFTYAELTEATEDETQDRRPEILKRLESFASRMLKENKVTADTVVRYFGGMPHLEACFLLHKNFPDVHTPLGTLAHVMLPVDEKGIYFNNPLKLSFKGVVMPPKDEGTLFIHLGKAFYAQCSRETLEAILLEQKTKEGFARLVGELKTIDVKDILSPDENCPIG